ncbi:unnamed protein product [Prorocentrum cordatum]|uniref:Cellulase n=1 Tax=Prorocentrum cordatum TaxID=2364126 RepID=A0ABN9T087_9DINO|nr:unnamed protein product [Polarella glacialis]
MVGEEESPPGGGMATTLAVGEEEGPPPAGCKEGDHVPCPGSGNMCAGNQCCPRTAESGGKTFPCPSAADSFAGCENNTKLGTCLPGGVTATSLMVGAEQGSPGGGTPTTRMVGEEEGPTATTLMVGEEESPTATTLMVGEEESPMATTLMVGEEESPPGGGTATTLMVGEEEGPTATTLAVGEEEGPTATTLMVGEEEGPTATTLMVGEEESPPGGGMATTLAVGEEEGPPPAGCKEGDNVPCPGSGNMCAGNQCCPGTAESGGKTFPCPSAADSFADCENNTKLGTCPPGGGTATTLMVGEEVYLAACGKSRHCVSAAFRVATIRRGGARWRILRWARPPRRLLVAACPRALLARRSGCRQRVRARRGGSAPSWLPAARPTTTCSRCCSASRAPRAGVRWCVCSSAGRRAVRRWRGIWRPTASRSMELQ